MRRSRSNKAHKQMTNMWFPGMNPELIERADHRRIVNPTGKDMMLSKAKRKYFANKSGFLPGMWAGGHSQFNHDALTIMIRAA